MPTMLTSGGKQKKQRTRKVGDPVPTLGVPTFDGGPDADDVQNSLEAVIGGHDHQRERVRSHANSGADILLLLHDRCEAAEGGRVARADDRRPPPHSPELSLLQHNLRPSIVFR